MIHLGACYYPEHWPRERWPEDARLMRAAGFDTVRVGEFAWAALEPRPGRFALDWLVEAVDVLAAEGLSVVLGTPTAAPPPWLTRSYPEVLFVGEDGHARRPGSRRHVCVNSPIYRELSASIVRALADALGRHPAVVGWQIDNELGCHDTARCICPRCIQHFRDWLRARYGTLAALNEAWGTVFWSQTYGDWDEIEPPVRLVYEANPGHWLDWCRAASAGNEAFLAAQAALLREHSPGRWLTHNLMGGFDALDHARLVAPLDLVGWDNYAPPGWAPVQQAMAHDRMRGLLDRPFWVLEQQCGPINWGAYNPAPRPGQARLWTYQAIAHGADGVLYFRWRAGLVGAEQLHSGILPHDGVPGRTYRELAAVARELAALPPLAGAPARVALLVGEPNRWALHHQPHHAAVREAGADAYDLPYYRTLRGFGLDVDIRPPTADLTGYALVVAATQYLVDDALGARLAGYVEAGGQLLLGVRSGFKDGHNRVRPGGLAALAGARVAELHAPSPDDPNGLAFAGGPVVATACLLECLEPGPDTEVVATYTEDYLAGLPGVTSRPLGAGRVWYVGALGADDALARAMIELVAGAAGLSLRELPDGVELARRAGPDGPVTFVLNHRDREIELPWDGGRDVLAGRAVVGGLRLPPYGVAVLTTGS